LYNYWPRFLVISLVVITPCLWHKHIEAGDLPSHVYNAWLVHLIKTGQAPGLWIASRWNNVLFDFALSGLGNIVGWGAAEKIATSGAVLIFFWGAFALVCATARRLSWFVLPCLAIVAYGWTFEMGFMNCYISIGLAFFGLAILARGRGWEHILVAVLAPLIWLAHPLGMALLVTLGSFTLLAERLSLRHRLYLVGIAVLFLGGMHILIRIHYPARSVTWAYEPRFVHDGTDQLLLYGPQYLLPARLFRAFLCACLLVDVMRRRRTPRWWSAYLLPSELYALTLLGILLVPAHIDSRIFQQMGFLSVGLLTERLTSVSAVLACCLLGATEPQKWHLFGFTSIALIFFFFLYNDTGTVNRMEDQLDRIVRDIPQGRRVVATIVTFPCRVTTQHLIDRACIRHCFSYGNYEPALGQFRVRASFGNPFVMSDTQIVGAAQAGDYVVRSHDLPLIDVYQCDLSATELCMRELAAGDRPSSGLRHKCTWIPRFNAVSLLFDLLLATVMSVGPYWGRWLVTRLKRAAP
jgi:hypothetical protein